MMRVYLGLAAVFAMLTGCGDAGSDTATGEAMSQREVAAAADAAVRPEPGQYRTTVELIDLEMPSIPGVDMADVRSTMESSMQRANLSCITAEDAERGYREMLRQSQQGACEFERFSADGGRLDAAMTCQGEGAQGRMTMTGTATPTSSNVTMNMQSEIAQLGDMAITMRVRSERVGDCPA